jgi:hypothetical protein
MNGCVVSGAPIEKELSVGITSRKILASGPWLESGI